MQLSIVIVSYNAGARLLRCLRTIECSIECAFVGQAGRSECEIIVVDNNSSDPLIGEVRREFDSVIWIQNTQNKGFSSAVNAGASRARGEFLLLLNPDCELSNGAIGSMLAAFRRHWDVAGMGFRQVDENGELQLSLGWKPGYFTEVLRKLVQRQFDHAGRLVRKVVDWHYNKTTRVSWVAGSVLLVRLTDFHRVGGFDENFFLYFEDIDFCMRLGSEVGRIVYEPSITIVHYRGQSALTAVQQSQQAYRKSQLYYWEKHRGPFHRKLIHLYLGLTGTDMKSLDVRF